MVYGCGNRMVKFLFFSANLLICFFGGLIFGFSMWANLDKDFAANLEKFARSVHHDNLNVLAKYQASLWVLVAIGALLFLVGFLGCCGAMCESTVLLSLFFVIVLILTVIELGAAVLAVSSKSEFKDSLRKLLGESTDANHLTKLRPIEDLFQCCGATAETKNLFDCDQSKEDCFTVISEWIESTGETVVVIAFVLLAVELFALVFTCILCRAFRERSPYYYA
uniref:Tetraspanin n=1 Tax=Parascaris univalens TaxID=6257 RepID=A0A915BZU8_PARUN